DRLPVQIQRLCASLPGEHGMVPLPVVDRAGRSQNAGVATVPELAAQLAVRANIQGRRVLRRRAAVRGVLVRHDDALAGGAEPRLSGGIAALPADIAVRRSLQAIRAIDPGSLVGGPRKRTRTPRCDVSGTTVIRAEILRHSTAHCPATGLIQPPIAGRVIVA